MIFVAVLYAVLQIASASTQTPTLTACEEHSDSSILSVADIKVSNAVIGSEIHFNYSLTVSEDVDDNPQLAFTMSSGESELPCVNHLGSCAYKMCNGSGPIEQQVGAAWDNQCPIPAGTYPGDLDVTIPSLASLFIENNTIHVEIEGFTDTQILGCVAFDITVEDAE